MTEKLIEQEAPKPRFSLQSLFLVPVRLKVGWHRWMD